jgi:hypothetical protein
MLEKEPALQAITLLEYLQEKYPDAYPDSVGRTLQRWVKKWLSLHGPSKEVMFYQSHEPGRQGLSDFTQLKKFRLQLSANHLTIFSITFVWRIAIGAL